jgi:hypothetical protein
VQDGLAAATSDEHHITRDREYGVQPRRRGYMHYLQHQGQHKTLIEPPAGQQTRQQPGKTGSVILAWVLQHPSAAALVATCGQLWTTAARLDSSSSIKVCTMLVLNRFYPYWGLRSSCLLLSHMCSSCSLPTASLLSIRPMRRWLAAGNSTHCDSHHRSRGAGLALCHVMAG